MAKSKPKTQHPGAHPSTQGYWARAAWERPRQAPGRGAEFDSEWLKGWDDADARIKAENGLQGI